MKKLFILAATLIAAFSSCKSQNADNSQLPTGYENLNIEEFKAKMSDPGSVILDVRTPEETAQGMIEGAVQLDFRSPDFEAEVDKLDKNKMYLVYCRTGNRSGKTCALMAKKGFKHFYNLEGGYLDWTKK
jgi:rhodanese-related sulfurtransferase